ncbi:MAG: hypothetical protein IJC88_04265 [Oscillospiraceae bacterium]|nr:hypothetical protein [Oscillospiraceae bacterium]
MKAFFEKHRTLSLIVLGVFAVVILFFYLRALHQPGVWYRQSFLAQQEDGSFSGRDEWYNAYRLSISSKTLDEAEVSLKVNDETRIYCVTFGETVTISENGTTVFTGQAHEGDPWLLIDQAGDPIFPITVYAGGVTPKQEELFPNLNTVYNWATMETPDTRGETSVIFVLILILVFLFIDIHWPDLFWNLRYCLAVDGGEPSEFYRVCQGIGRILMVILFFIAALSGLNLFSR